MSAYSCLFLAIAFVAASEAFLFGGGGGGCGCAPPPPPPCCLKLELPPLCLPQLPPPCLPQIPLPQIPTCGGCGRKKREIVADTVHCTDPELRRIIIQNIDEDYNKASHAIKAEAQAYLNSKDIAVTCLPSSIFNFATTVDTFCIDGSVEHTCGVFKLK